MRSSTTSAPAPASTRRRRTASCAACDRLARETRCRSAVGSSLSVRRGSRSARLLQGDRPAVNLGSELAGRNRGHPVLVEGVEGVEHGPRPSTGGLGAAQVPLRGRRLGAGLLAEDVIGELAAPVGVDLGGGDRGQRHKSRAGELTNTILGKAEELGQVVVALASLKEELDDRPLVLGELIEGRHARRTVACGP